MTEEKVKIREISTNIKISGAGEPILILHGWGSSSDSLDEVRKVLSNNGYRVITPDLPGFGKSGTPTFAWTLDDYVDWTADLVESVQIKDFSLMGHSFGGRVSIKFATKYPEVLKNLVLEDPAGIKISQSLKTQIIIALAELGNLLFKAKFLRKLKEFFRDLLFSFIKKRDYVQANSLMKQVMKNALSDDLAPILPLVKTKTLVIWGSEDKVVPIKYSKVYVDNIKNSHLEVFQGAGHSPHATNLVTFCEAVDKFLKTEN